MYMNFSTPAKSHKSDVPKDHQGAAEPNAQGCAFAHPIFGSLVNNITVLRTQHFGHNYNLRTQSWIASVAPAYHEVFLGLIRTIIVKKNSTRSFIFILKLSTR